MISKWQVALTAALLGILVWALVDRSRAVDAVYAERDLGLDDYVYDRTEASTPDLFQVPAAASARPTDGNSFDKLRADLERDDSSEDLTEVHIKYFRYKVERGDSLWQLQDRFNVGFELIYELNRVLIDRNYSRRCGEPCGLSPTSGHCSTPEATLTPGMILKIPTKRIYIAPLPSASVKREDSSLM